MKEPTNPETIAEMKAIYDALISGLGPASPSPATAAHGGEAGRCTTELYHTERMMPVYARKLMPAVEAASMSYDRRRSLRRAAIYDAWVNAGHYSKDIQPLNDVALIEIALDAIEEADQA